MKKTVGFCMALLFVLPGAPPAHAMDGVEKPYDARLENANIRQRFEIDSRMIDLVRRGIHYEADRRTRELSEFMLNSLIDFSAVQIYDSPMLKDLEDGYRGVTLFGKDDGKQYHVETIESTYAVTEIVEFGDMALEFAVLKNEQSLAGGRSFDGDVRFKSLTGAFSHQDIQSAIEENLRIIDPRNVQRMAAPETGLFKDVKGHARSLINEYGRMFPSHMQFMDLYSNAYNRVLIKGRDDRTYTRMEFKGAFDYEVLKKDYPRMARHLDKIRRMSRSAKMDFLTPAGNSILTIEFSGQDNFLAFTLCTRDGAFIPRDHDGKPVFEEAVSPLTDEYDFTVEIELCHQVYGLTMETDNIIVAGTYRGDEKGGVLGFRLVTIPRTRVLESFLYVIPPSMMNAMKPIFLDRLINDLGRVLVQGNKGRGAVFELRSDTSNREKVQAGLFASGEVLDNFFIRFGMRVMRSRLIPDMETDLEIRRFIVKSLELLADDMRSTMAFIDGQTTDDYSQCRFLKKF